jgi:V8-like Glu-specific endopeptidase
MRVAAAAVLIAAAACSGGPDLGRTGQPIVGGAADAGDPAVAYLELAGGACSGALIAPTVVLTAAHCAAPAAGLARPGTASFGAAVGAFDETIDVTQVWVARDWPGDQGADVALVRLAGPAAAAPLAWRAAPLPAMTGRAVRVVGFGRTVAADPATAGTKRQVTLTVRAIDGADLIAGDAAADTCTGDSGGPVLADVGGGEEIVAVVSSGDVGCAGDARLARLDVQRLVDVALAAWDGPCAQDGACAAGCAPLVDPDCDPCGLDGACAAGCPAVDLDCPLGAGPGDACAAAPDCEGRRCVAAPDAAGVSFCSAACAAAADCPAPLDACDAAGACVFAGGTPGILGAPCAAAADCRSNLCDTSRGGCAEPCGAGSSCPDGFACEPVGDGKACTLPDGGCAAGGAPDLALVGLVLALGLRRRRRARPAT